MQLFSVVIPIYNERENISELVSRLMLMQSKAPYLEFEFIFVDDGSTDGSVELLKTYANGHYDFKIVILSRNFGHQIALSAGVDKAMGDYVGIIDGDLQDPPELLIEMYALAQNYDVVYGKRKKRLGESAFKKMTALLFYRLLNWMCSVDIPLDTGDFRVINKRVADAFRTLPERHRFVRGMIPWLGFKSCPYEYDRDKRFAGVTKYPLSKMVAFATNAILSFSSKPLSLAVNLGLLSILFSLVASSYFLYVKFFTDIAVPGITAVLIMMGFLGGVQIFLLGVVGQYIARIFEEAKNRPLYVIAELVNITA